VQSVKVAGWVRRVLTYGVVTAVVSVLMAQAGLLISASGQLVKWATRPAAETGLLWIADRKKGEIFMTNVDPTVPGFFTGEAAFGGCQEASLRAERPDPSRCFVHFVRGYPETLKRTPSAYLWFALGNQFCSPPNCLGQGDIEAKYGKAFGNATMAVFDLSTRRVR
jgi:hypothetical protein